MNGLGRLLGALGAVGGGLGVAAGAVAAHVLRLEAGTRDAHLFDTAVNYLLLHAVLVVALAVTTRHRGWFVVMGLMLAGMVCFSGGLMVQVGTGNKVPLIPFGGLCFIAGWLVAAGMCLWRRAS